MFTRTIQKFEVKFVETILQQLLIQLLILNKRNKFKRTEINKLLSEQEKKKNRNQLSIYCFAPLNIHQK